MKKKEIHGNYSTTLGVDYIVTYLKIKWLGIGITLEITWISQCNENMANSWTMVWAHEKYCQIHD